MEVKHLCLKKRFKKTLMTRTIQFLAIGSLSVHTFPAFCAEPGKWEQTTSYLDPAIWSIVVNQEQCFQAAPRSLIEVEPTIENGQRVYKVSQYFDPVMEKHLYAQSLEDQIKNHKIVGRSFCRGVVSHSDMELPFVKDTGFKDANDGLLLVDSVRRGLSDISEQLHKAETLAIQAANGVYSSTQLSQLNTEFQAVIAEINTHALTKRFNGTMLLDGSTRYLTIPIDEGRQSINVPLFNATTGTAGLNIQSLDIMTQSDAQAALEPLYTSEYSIENTQVKLNAIEISLTAAAKRNEVITFIDVRNDNYVVQRKTPSSINKG
ncbi:MAG: flagellin N-terminal helical domain-containing protein [Gammaproteobacteria bacterium]